MALTKINSKGIKDGEILNADINASAAIAKSKLASLDIVNADVNASAAIAGSKISPSFTSDLTITDISPAINFTDSNNDSDFRIIVNDGKIKIQDTTNSNAERFVVNSSGNVGIGESAPANLLHVKVSDTGVSPHASAQIVLERAGTNYLQFLTTNTGTSGILFGDGDDADVAQIKYDHNIPAMQFLTETAERMRIDSAGRILIGTTSTVIGSSSEFNEIVLSGKTRGAGITLQDVDANTRFQIRTDDNGDGTLLNASTNHPLAIRTNNTERMRIAADGKVGIGTTSPSAKLEISARGDTEKGILLKDSNAAEEAPYIEVIGNRSDGNSSQCFSGKLHLARNRSDQKVTVNNMLGAVAFGGNHTDGSESNILYSASISAIAADSFDSSTDMPTDLVFMTGSTGRTPTAVNVSAGTERLRIKHNGEVRIGNTGSIGQGTNGTLIPQAGIIKHSRDVGGGSATFQAFGNAGRFQVLGDGDAQNTNNSYDGISDQNLKENIVDANSQWDDIKALKIRNYNFKESTKFSTHKQIGVIAQELETLGMNSLVKDNDEDGYKAVKYSVLYMKAIKALQEAMTKIETLETKVAALEAA